MGEKAIISGIMGMSLMVGCGLISLVEYILYLLRVSPFMGVIAGYGFMLGIIFFVLGMIGMYGDN